MLEASFRLRLAAADAIVGLSLLGVLAGLVTGVVAIAFRLITEHTLVWLEVLPEVERYETLSWEWRFGLPLAGDCSSDCCSSWPRALSARLARSM